MMLLNENSLELNVTAKVNASARPTSEELRVVFVYSKRRKKNHDDFAVMMLI
jgi:hypothetical protein